MENQTRKLLEEALKARAQGVFNDKYTVENCLTKVCNFVHQALKSLPEEKGESEMQIETKLIKATLTHQAGTLPVILVIQPHTALNGTVILSIREETNGSINDVVVNISELKEVVEML